MNTERTIEILLKFVNSEITHNSNDAYCNITDIDYAVEQESTADGFSVYTFKHPIYEYSLINGRDLMATRSNYY